MLRYVLAIFLGAFLLFEVQPLIGKFILPWFGGGPAVWTACMLFFQLLLLAGYAYAHFLRTKLPQRKQAIIHVALLVAAVAALPIIPGARWKPGAASDPTWGILLLLAVSVGLPYLMLATTSPLLQAWFSVAHPGKSPYRLYALSNVGSLLALVSYPFLVEPAFSLTTQAILWSAGFGLFAIVGSICALRTPGVNAPAEPAPAPPEPDDRGQRADDGGQTTEHGGERTEGSEENAEVVEAPGIGSRVLWVALTACGSLMLLAVTNQMCADVAIVPFLWVLPLTVYLLSFILCFHSTKWYPRVFWWVLLFVVMGGGELTRQVLSLPVKAGFGIFGTPEHPDLKTASSLAKFAWNFVMGKGFLGPDLGAGEPVSLMLGGIPWLFNAGVDATILGQIIGFSLALFVCCMVCHGELVRLKPNPRYLTSFYLLSSAGGAVGGACVSLVAPRVFPAYLELHVGLWLCCALAMAAFWADRKPHRHWRTRWWVGLYPPAFIALLVTLGLALKKDADGTIKDSRFLTRGFYGVLRVKDYDTDDPESHYFSLQHGRISHGNQYADPVKRLWPTTYYARKSGVGLAIRHLTEIRLEELRSKARPGAPPVSDSDVRLRVGVVGLGTGTIAAYAQKDDYYRFYDINPAVQRIAESWFHYLGDSKDRGADVDVVLGDARLSLERQEPQHYDVLALDAFTSDAIPIHLLTREAFDVYLNRQIKPNDGVLAVHISNRYLDLEPVVLAQAEHFGYTAVIVESKSDKERALVYSATWILVTRNKKFLECEPIRDALEKQAKPFKEPAEGEDEDEADAAERAETRRLLSRRVHWTDDYSNLVVVLRERDELFKAVRAVDRFGLGAVAAPFTPMALLTLPSPGAMGTLGILAWLGLGAVTAFLAARKGYSPFAWFFSASVLGLSVLVVLPQAGREGQGTDDAGATRRLVGNLVGLGGSVLTLGCGVLLALIG